MKKCSFFIVLIIFFSFFSCNKEIRETENINLLETKHMAIPMNSDAKAKIYALRSYVGHLASQCSEKGCVIIGDLGLHVNCQGFGSACLVSFSVMLHATSAGDVYELVTLNKYDLTGEDFFMMPSRSLLVEVDEKGNEVLWLNIPEQLLERDEKTQQFTFKGVYYSSHQKYKNE